MAGEDELSLIEISEVGAHRAVCNLATDSGSKLVGLYAVQDGRIAAACHYFSDIELLTEFGVLPLADLPNETQEPHAPPATAARASHPRASLSLGENLRDARLAHRQHRLRLAIHALDLRIEALHNGGQPTPLALIAALRGFQQELDDARAGEPQSRPTHDEHEPATTAEPDSPNRWSAQGIDDVYPGTTLVGSCSSCRRLLFAHEPHDWQDVHTHDLCTPYDDGAALFCGSCSGL